MASPVDAARTGTNIITAATSHAINVGSPASGTLLVVFVRAAGATGGTTFTGYTAFVNDSTDASDDQTLVYWRLADGTEGATDTLTTVNSIKLAAICWGITGAALPATTPPETGNSLAVGTTANATTNTCTPLSGLSQTFLFLTMLGMDSETATATIPSPYANQTSANSGTGGAVATNCIIWGGSLQKTTVTEDPASWTSSAPNAGWTTVTIAISPPAPTAVFGTEEQYYYSRAVKQASNW